LVEKGKNISNLFDNISNLNEEQITEWTKIINQKRLKESKEEKDNKMKNLFKESVPKNPKMKKLKKYIILSLLNYTDFEKLLDIHENDTNENNKSVNENENSIKPIINDKKIKITLDELEHEIKNIGNIEIWNKYLRKMVCLKLYKVLKNYNLKNNDIKRICLYIKIQGKIIDNSMRNKHKEFIENVFKTISH